MKFKTKVFLNKKNGQMSITIPKKKFKKKLPKELTIDIKKIKW
jgi:hypothetical protein